MKKLYFGALGLIFAFSAAFIWYGIELNVTSGNYIEKTMARHAVRLHGAKAVYREIRPEIAIDYVTLRSREISDATARIDGTIEALFVSRGQRVKRGDLICRIENMGVTLQLARAETDVAKAEAAWIQAKSDMDRTSRLAKKDAVSRSELEASVARAKSAKSELDAAKIARDQAARKRALQTVTSPGDGDVLVLYQDAGNFVAAGTPIALIGDFSVMSMRVSLPDEKVRNLLSSGTPSFQESYAFHVNIGGGAGGKAFDNDFNGGYSLDASFDARVENVSPPLGESAAARNVTWVIANSSNILEEGLFTGAIIRSRQSRRVLSVPKDALRNMNTGVYVADAGSRLAWRDVRTGVYDAGFIEITEGFKEGDMVVISGVGGLKPGQRIDLREEETP